MKKKAAKQLRVLGRSDVVDLPDLGLLNVDVKIDTGAYTSSIHCSRIKMVKEADGTNVVTFTIPGSKLHEKGIHRFRVKEFEQRSIRSSNGQLQKRFVIQSHIILFGKRLQTEFSLADRSKMKFPVLLGRQLLHKRFLVDVSKTNLSFKEKPKP